MRTITKYQTFDGFIHRTKELALEHLGICEKSILSTVQSKISRLFQYAYNKEDGSSSRIEELAKARTEMGEYIMDNLELFARLQTIRADREIIDDENE